MDLSEIIEWDGSAAPYDPSNYAKGAAPLFAVLPWSLALMHRRPDTTEEN